MSTKFVNSPAYNYTLHNALIISAQCAAAGPAVLETIAISWREEDFHCTQSALSCSIVNAAAAAVTNVNETDYRHRFAVNPFCVATVHIDRSPVPARSI